MKKRRIKPEIIEAMSAAYYDEMIGQVPHTEGWAGKSEAFKEKVREKMEIAVHVGIKRAKELDDGRTA